jgi:hemerythrin-like domain-containing protein
MESERRHFLLSASAFGIATLVPLGATAADDKATNPGDKKDEEEINASEDLMREHGILNRILLIYEDGLRRVQNGEDVPPDAFHKPALLARKYVEDHHEQLEECFIFPLFEEKKRLVDLVKVLREQHRAGRKVTDVILRNAVPDQYRKEDARKELVAYCRAFIRMYRPHEAREDTVLFPALHQITTSQQLKDLGEQFEQEEDKLFGQEGFEKTVDQVAAIEKQLGIYDLSQFTPK